MDDPPASTGPAPRRSRRANAGNRMAAVLLQERVEMQVNPDYGKLAGDEDDEFTLTAEAEAAEREADAAIEQEMDHTAWGSSDDGDDGGEDADQDEDGQPVRITAEEREVLRAERLNGRARRRKRTMLEMMEDRVTRKRPRPDNKTDGRAAEPTGSLVEAVGSVDAAAPLEVVEIIATAEPAEPSSTAPRRLSVRSSTQRSRARMLDKLKEKQQSQQSQTNVGTNLIEKRPRKGASELTQQDRLRIAAETEEQNRASLCKWQQQEESKADERRARIRAARSHAVAGPKTGFWTGPAVWLADRLYVRMRPAEIEAAEQKWRDDRDRERREAREAAAAELERQRARTLIAESLVGPRPAAAVDDAVKAEPRDEASGDGCEPDSAPDADKAVDKGAEVPAGAATEPAPETEPEPASRPGGADDDEKAPLVAAAEPPLDTSGKTPPETIANAVDSHTPDDEPAPLTVLSTTASGESSVSPPLSSPPASPIEPLPAPGSAAYYSLLAARTLVTFDHPDLLPLNPSPAVAGSSQKQAGSAVRTAARLAAAARTRETASRQLLIHLLEYDPFPAGSNGVSTDPTAQPPTSRRTKIHPSSAALHPSPSDRPHVPGHKVTAGIGRGKIVCPITNRVAKYADPLTGIPYRDREAYACLHRLVGHRPPDELDAALVDTDGLKQGGKIPDQSIWNGSVGAYLSASCGGEVAKGVPDGFL